jgi:cation transport protein ChaC
MWVFGYGSLMWDGWEQPLGGLRIDGAVLTGFRRSFNKQSVTNWGTSNGPGPTLGLEPRQAGKCIGTAFSFPDKTRTAVVNLLTRREGPSFALIELPVLLPDGREIIALTPVNDRSKSTYIGNVSLKKRAAMAKTARGNKGACADYIRNIYKKLDSLGIPDSDVEEFWTLVRS